MKNKGLEVFLVLLIAEILLVGYSWLVSCNGADSVTQKISFMKFETLSDFEQKDANLIADSLLATYLADTNGVDTLLKRHPISLIGPKKQNIFLVNPAVDGVTALDGFFKAVQEIKDTAVIRIAHYGDSQLEGDRMSCIVRQKFHERFGGTGQGYVPLKDLSPVSYTRSSSGNWARYTVFHDKYYNNYYGLSGLVFRFSRYAVYQSDDDTSGSHPAVMDSGAFSGGPMYNASVSVKLGENLKYNTVSVMYGRTHEHTILNYYNNETGEKIATDTLQPSEEVCLHKRKLEEPVLKLRLEFSAGSSPDFYGVYLDGLNGIQVDNYAIRGHSGDGLMLINDDHLASMIKLLNTRLIIFQYGANVVPYIHSDKACEWLSGIYYDLFMKFRKAAPQISILVIGPGDMARGGEGGYGSYSWLPKINDAVKQGALKAGCAYWDLFNMMGGLNSIMVWTSKKLAVTNGHFSNKGQEIIANELVDALMVEYNLYQHNQRKNK
jgi:hypothetical protein